MDSPSHVYATIPYEHFFFLEISNKFFSRHTSSFTYDRESIIERIPTRSVLVCDRLTGFSYSNEICFLIDRNYFKI
jgi:hypothetical protein